MAKALVKQITMGVFEDGMRFVALADVCQVGVNIEIVVNTELLPLDANPSQVSQAIIDAVVARANELLITLDAADVYAYDMVRGV